MSCEGAETIVWPAKSGAPLSISILQPGLHFFSSIANGVSRTTNNGAV